MYQEQIFEVKSRKEIFSYIEKNPGVHFRKLCRELKIPASTLSYHLKYLTKKKLLINEVENGYSRYYPSKKVCNGEKKLIAILREETPRNIILYLFLFSDSSKKDIVEFAKKWKNHPSKIGYHLNKHRTTIDFHIKKLSDEGILKSFNCGNEVKYRLKNPEDIIDIIIRYQKSLLSNAYGHFLKYLENADSLKKKDAFDRVLDLFNDMFPVPFCS